MYGVVSLLDEPHNEKVESIWAELQAQFGVHGVRTTPVAHFSYHVAQKYHSDSLSIILGEIASQTKPFQVRTVGLGIFTGDDPVLYMSVRLDPVLITLHQQLWDALADVTVEPLNLYHPHRWQPHITLTHKDVNHDLLPEVVRILSERDFYWTITVNNLALLGGDDTHSVITRIPFGK
ncbi:MAG: 2'-5' RNA ligase family protein [Chloroflexota bacterium]